MGTVSKWNGTGNDFVVVEGVDVADEAAFARAVCDRNSGLDHPDARRRGADGVLFLSRVDDSPLRVRMRHVQPDGSTPDMCGNGVRCAAKWAADEFGVDRVVLEPPAGPHPATVDGRDIAVQMRPPSFAPGDVPLARSTPLIEETVEGLTVTAVSTGVPHAVAFVDDVAETPLAEVAPPVRYADVFPEGANVTLAGWTGDGAIAQRTYERGVEGETDACGTGAVAIGAVAVETGQAAPDEPLHIAPPGGRLTVTVGEASTTLTGPAEREFAVDLATVLADHDVSARQSRP